MFYLDYHTILDKPLRSESVRVFPVLLVPVKAVQVHLDKAASGNGPSANLVIFQIRIYRIMLNK